MHIERLIQLKHFHRTRHMLTEGEREEIFAEIDRLTEESETLQAQLAIADELQDEVI